MTSTPARFEAVVRGQVQGVGFRYFVLRRAKRLGLSGWVANEPDGTLRCAAEGAVPALEELLEALRHGPPGARVDDVAVTPTAVTGQPDGFSLRATGHAGD